MSSKAFCRLCRSVQPLEEIREGENRSKFWCQTCGYPILLDVLMPGIDGLEVCRWLRAKPTLRDTPIVLLTALNDPGLDAKGRQAGANLIMRKLFGPGLIVNNVDKVLGRKPRPRPL